MSKRPNWSWLVQSVSGLALLLLIGLHMVAHHFIVKGGLRDYREVLAYIGNPIVLVLEIAFLIVVTAHALAGVRSILFDLGLSDRAERVVSNVAVVIGIATIAYGVWLTYTILAHGGASTAGLP